MSGDLEGSSPDDALAQSPVPAADGFPEDLTIPDDLSSLMESADDPVTVALVVTQVAVAGPLAAACSLATVEVDVVPNQPFPERFVVVAGKTRVMEDEFISASGTDVTDAFRLYLRPLLGSGMPEAFRLRPLLLQLALSLMCRCALTPTRSKSISHILRRGIFLPFR